MGLLLSSLLCACVFDVGGDLLNATKDMYLLNGLTFNVAFNYIEVGVMFGICSFIQFCTLSNTMVKEN